MSSQFVIDAFNLINRTWLAQNTDPVRALIDLIITRRPQGSINNKVTLVFDGFPKLDFRCNKYPNVEIIFSREVSADEVIKQILAKASGDKSLVLITDDREIIDAAKLNYIEFKSTTEFIGKLDKSKPGKKQETSEGKNMSYSDMSKINNELRELWLKKKG